MKIFIKQNPNDTILLGLIRILLLAFIIIILEYLIIFLLFAFFLKNYKGLDYLLYIMAVPAGITISDIYNAVILMINSYKKAAKLNLVIAFLAVLIFTAFFKIMFK